MGILDKLKKDSTSSKASSTPKATKESKKEVKESAKKPAAKKTATKKTVATAEVSRNRQVIIKPLVTEKASVSGAYYFQVDPKTNKSEVKKAFESLYGKKPRKVNIMNRMGKAKRFGRVQGKRADWKKAVVYLNKGETIDVFA